MPKVGIAKTRIKEHEHILKLEVNNPLFSFATLAVDGEKIPLHKKDMEFLESKFHRPLTNDYELLGT